MFPFLYGLTKTMGLPKYNIEQFPENIQAPVTSLGEWIAESSIKREDFSELKDTVASLSQTVKELAEAQKDTDQSIKELTESQKRTDLRIEELTLEMKNGFKRSTDSIAALGSRWGLQSEQTFRNALQSLLARTGYTVEKGYYGDREVDVVIKNGEHILLEITSALKKKDIASLNRSAEDYFIKENIEPKLMIAAIYISPTVMREIHDSPRPIELFSEEEED